MSQKINYPKIGIIAAMEKEVQGEFAQNPAAKKITIAMNDYYELDYCGHDVVFCTSGIGKVSAAIAAQAMIDNFGVSLILNFGCAGAIAPEAKVGSVILVTSTVEWDFDTTALGDTRSEIVALGKVYVEASEPAISIMREAIKEKGYHLVEGVGVSGDQFVNTAEQTNEINECFKNVACADMEAGAINHVCAQNGVSFCSVKGISDGANDDSIDDYSKNATSAGLQALVLMRQFLHKIS